MTVALIKHISEKNHSESKKEFKRVLGNKITKRIEKMSEEVASSIGKEVV